MDTKTGETMWVSEKAALIGPMTTLAHWQDGLLVASFGKLQCRSMATGDLLWEDSLPGAPVALATSTDYTNYNSSTLIQAIEQGGDNNRGDHTH
jgi:hypothetical protein